MSVIPVSSDQFSYMLAKAVNRVDGGGDFIRNVDAVWRFAVRSGLADRWGVDKVQAHMAAAFKAVPARYRRSPR
jgi:hypothetical protein